MSFSASLTFTNQTTPKNAKDQLVVLSCTYSFYKAKTPSGQPISNVMGGNIYITVVASGNLDFVNWMFATQPQDGKITFYQRDNADQVQKEIDFKGAYLVGYTEEFTSTGSNPVVEKLILTAKTITVGDKANTMDNNWV